MLPLLKKWWYVSTTKHKWLIAFLLLLVLNSWMIFDLKLVSRLLWSLNFVALGFAMFLPSDYD